MRVRPWEARPGDRLVGLPGFVVAGARYAGRHPLGGDIEAQRYGVSAEDGRTITYAGDSWIFVIRRRKLLTLRVNRG